MAHETIAPWAEKVPGAGPLTADELLRMPDDAEWTYELVDGVLVRMPAPGFEHGWIIGDLLTELGYFVKSRRLGITLGAETGFLLSQAGQPDTVLAPDLAFIRAERVPSRHSPGIKKYQRLAPDLAVEVVSPDQYKPEMATKAKIYLNAGVRLLWIVWPGNRTVDVWRPGSDQPITSLTISDALDGLDVVPGFTYPLADLFG